MASFFSKTSPSAIKIVNLNTFGRELLLEDLEEHSERVALPSAHCFPDSFPNVLNVILKLINNSSSQNKANHYREGGLEM